MLAKYHTSSKKKIVLAKYIEHVRSFTYKQLFCSIVPHVTLLRTHLLGEFIFQPHHKFFGPLLRLVIVGIALCM
jgi:hypothetical protein